MGAIEPHLLVHPPFTVIGLHTRTTNAAEADPSAARLPALWGEFLQRGGPSQVPGSGPRATTFSVYRAYESNHEGAYDVVLGAEVAPEATAGPGWTRVEVPRGHYLVFQASGPMPAIVVRTWAVIWEYFDKRSDVQRAFTADFEMYDPSYPDRVSVYVAVTGPVADASASSPQHT